MGSSPVAIVTGASRGIGRAGAVALAEAGFDVVVSARTVREGEVTAKQAVIDALRRAQGARGIAAAPAEDDAPVEQNFVEDQGGIY